jgi:photosystem II stability/assembly factor-like uncharacterized protein
MIRISSGAVLALLLVTVPAAGNGRYPSAQLVLQDPSNPDRLWVRATHGIMTSADRGCMWHWICEAALHYTGTDDPMLGVMADGTVVAATFEGLVTSRNHGCDWTVEGPMSGRYVADLSVQKDDATRAVAITSNSDSPGSFLNRVWRTTDSAASWTQLGQDLPSDAVPFTIDTAPSDARRVYVSAQRYLQDAGFVAESLLLRSDDDGATWTTLPVGSIANDLEPYLSAIHPNDPSRIYLRLRDQGDPTRTVVNRVLFSADAGENWQEIFVGAADILGFALSPDGSRVALGLGDSRAPVGERPVDPSVLGLYTASTADHEFVRRHEGQVGCISWSSRGMYFCGAGYEVQGKVAFELGFTNDEGASVTQVMELAGVEGPLACPAESQMSLACKLQNDWPGVCVRLGRCDPATGEVIQRPRGETCPVGPATGGAAGSSGSGGHGADPADAGGKPDVAAGSGGGPSVAPPASNSDDGCSVSRPGQSRRVAMLALVALTAILALIRRSRPARQNSAAAPWREAVADVARTTRNVGARRCP